jgi:Rhs element Vgr protein
MLDPSFEILEIEVHRELNRIPQARLVLVDGDLAQRQFKLSDQKLFVPGAKVKIDLRYEGENSDQTLFEGLIVRHAVEARDDGSLLRLELKDAAFKLTRARHGAVFRKQSDDEAIRQILRNAGIGSGKLSESGLKHLELIQYDATDWDFIVARADVVGKVVDVHLGKLMLAPMELAAHCQYKLEYGLGDVIEFEIEIDASQLWDSASGVSWDAPNQTLSAAEKAPPSKIGAGDLDAAAIAQALGGDELKLIHPVPLEGPELRAWADARLLRSRLSLLRGHIVVKGGAQYAPLDTAELVGIGKRFNGPALVSAVTHKIAGEGWTTELTIGLSPDWFARQPDIANVAAGGLLPPVGQLVIATVAGFEVDPLGEQRIKVRLPALDSSQGDIWARVARLDAGASRGIVFWPDPGDEVIVGFLGGDPRQAVILGSVHSSKAKPPAFTGGPNKDNFKRAIVSAKGVMIGFDDDKVVVSITTPAGQKIILDDDAKQITVADQHGNQITLNDQGIQLKSAKDFTIDAGSGKVVITGKSVDIQ